MSNEKIEMTPVVSSNVESVGFKDGKLQVQFKGGGLYSYNNVKPAVFEAFIKAPSPGKYFAANVKGKYTVTKLR